MKSKILFSALVAGSLLTSCTEEFTPPTEEGDNYKEAWKSIIGCSIDSKQTWNAAQALSITITTGEPATISVVTVDETPHLLYRCEVENSKLITFDVPQTSSQIRVIKTSESGREERVLTPATMTNKDSYLYFDGSGVEESAKAPRTRGYVEGDIPTVDCIYSEQDVARYLIDGFELPAKGKIGQRQNGNNMTDILYNSKTTTIIKVTKGGDAVDGDGYFGDNYPYIELNEWTVLDPDKNTYGTPSEGQFKLVLGSGVTFQPTGNSKLRNMHLIVSDGATLDLSKCAYNGFQVGAGGSIYVMPGGKIIDNSVRTSGWSIQLNGGITVYNQGTIEVPRFLINCDPTEHSHLYNADGGYIKTNDLALQNHRSEVTNWGKIETVRFSGNGSDEGQGTLNNACNITCTERFGVNILNLAANSELYAPSLLLNNVSLREGSILRSEELYFNATQCTQVVKDGDEYKDETLPQEKVGIHYVGNGSVDALVSTKELLYVNYGAPNFISSHVYLEVDKFTTSLTGDKKSAGNLPFDEAYEKSKPAWIRPLVDKLRKNFGDDNYVIPTVGYAPITIKAFSNTEGKQCTAGNTPKPGSNPNPGTPQSWIIAFEDQGTTGDFDFNDVVIRVTPSADENHTAKVELMAAGGTLSSVVYYNGSPIGQEVHSLFGVEPGKDGASYVNTQYPDEKDPVLLTETLSLGYDGTMATCAKLFALKSGSMENLAADKSQFITLNKETGNVPKAICVPADKWYWPRERVNIRTAYPDFKKWAEDYNEGALQGGSTWYDNYKKEYVIITKKK